MRECTGYRLVHQPFAYPFQSYLPPRIIVFRIGSRCAEERWPDDAGHTLAKVSIARCWPAESSQRSLDRLTIVSTTVREGKWD